MATQHPTIGMLKQISLEIFKRTLSGKTNFEQDTRTIRSYIDIGNQLNEPVLVAQLWGRLGIICFYNGRVGQAIEYILKAYELYREQGSTNGMAMTLNNLSAFCYLVGRYEDTLRYCEQGYEHIKDDTDNLVGAALLENLAAACWALGQREKAKATANRCLDIIGDRTKEALTSFVGAKIVLTELYLARGEYAAAWDTISLAHEFAFGRNDYFLTTMVLFTKAHVAAADPDHTTLSAAYYEEGRKTLTYDQTHIMQARMFMHEARYQMRHDHFSDAQAWLQSAYTIFQEVDAQEEAQIAAAMFQT